MSALEEFQQNGYLAPVPLFERWQARLWLVRLKNSPRRDSWGKSRAVHYPAYFRLARQPRIVNIIKQLIGENVILWGASLVTKHPGVDHPWHSDVETAYADGKTAAVWVALSDASDESGLQLVAGSHLFGASVQELCYLHSVGRSDTSNSRILDWARAYNPDSEVHKPDLKPGEAIIFDGRIWHSSINHTTAAKRTALLLQYAAPDVPIRVCESADDSPYIRTDIPGPRCLLISGRDEAGVNTLVSNQAGDNEMKPKERKIFMSTVTKHIDLPLMEDPATGKQSIQLGGGITPVVDRMSFHMSVLSPGITPHAPHSHIDEELLIMLSGEADLVMVPEEITGKQERHRLQAGSLVYYPAFYTHTIHNTSSQPATYLMFKWRSSVPSRPESLASVHQFDFPALSVENTHSKPWETQKIFSLPTRHLKKLHCHVSLLQPGSGYEAHRDKYDVAIVLLKGEIETLDRKLESFTVIYYASGEMHGLRNIGDTSAYYLVFEFHAGPTGHRLLRNGLQMWRILKGPLRQIPRNSGVFAANVIRRIRRLM